MADKTADNKIIPVSTNQSATENLMEGLEKYLPLLHFLYENRDGLYQLIFGIKEDGKIPRYAVPGIVKTKAVYMNNTVAKLAAEFSKEKNITQREVMETALIEYLHDGTKLPCPS